MKVPVAGFPGVDEKLIPVVNPDADRVTVFAGTSLSVPVTAKVNVELTATVSNDGLLTVGALLTSLIVMTRLAVLVAPRSSVALKVIV